MSGKRVSFLNCVFAPLTRLSSQMQRLSRGNRPLRRRLSVSALAVSRRELRRLRRESGEIGTEHSVEQI